jgi:ABC-type transport system involved in multi-copper enzyme maturation permease subunit
VSDVLTIAGLALRESVRRRVFVVVVVVTLVFGGLYAWGVTQLFDDVGGFSRSATETGIDARTLAGATVLGVAMFGTLFLGVVLATFLTLGAVRGDAERGLLQPLVVRPLGRTTYLAGRLLAAATVSGGYVAAVYAGATVVTGFAGDWWPQRPVVAGTLLTGAVVLVAALALLGSVLLSSTANGIAVLMIFGAGLTAGLLGEIGDGIGSPTLTDIAGVSSWVLPFEALYRAALAALVPDVGGITGAVIRLGPLGGSHTGGALLVPFAVAYLAGIGALTAWAFGRRDL